MTESFSLQVNHQAHAVSCAAGSSLLGLLRQQGYVGVHRVCETGDCGSCTVWVDGEAVHSCIYPARRAEGRSLTTIEGLGGDSPMQRAFLQEQGFQCGYCTPGMIMSAEKMTATTPEAIRQQMDGNLCRCTGYQAIVASIAAGKQGVDRTSETSLCDRVGENVPKQDGPDIVSGAPVYTDDIAPAGLLHLKVVRSPHAHARLRRINTEKATALPGVVLVLTHKDVERRPYSTAGHGAPVPDPHDHYLLDNKVRFVGDRVAAVVAETEAIAIQACALIDVDYELLPPVLDPVLAMGDRALEMLSDVPPPPAPPVIHDEPESFQIHDAAHNIAGEVRLEKGDVAAGFAAADLVLERTYQLPAVQHAHLEPHVSLSWLDEDGTLVVRSSTQVPFHCQRLLSELFDLPSDRIRVFKAKIGGGFGNKQEILTEDLCVWATLKTGRPVRWQFTRQEEFTATTSRHATQITLKMGMTRDGTLTAMEMGAIANTGAYGNHGTQVVFLTGSMPLGLYRCAHQRFVGRSVYTTTMPAGAFRGYGATQGVFAVECHLDEMAAILGLDSLDLRRRQVITPQGEILLGSDHHFHLIGSYGLEEAVARVQQRLGNPAPVIDGSRRRGVGFAIAMQGSGLAKIHEARVSLRLKPDGRYELRTGAVDVGTGSDTTLRQIIADQLNTTVESIDLIAADTQQTPFDAGSYASATLYISGTACLRAAQELRSLLLHQASQLLNLSPADFSLASTQVVGPTSLPLTTLAEKVLATGETLTVEQSYAADASTLTFAVQGVEVEVDLDTGRVTVLRCVQVLDIGKAINPRICEGQAIGGTVMGLGYALQEELIRDNQGQTVNPLFRTYRLPLAKEIPPIEIEFIEQPDPHGPLGAKGIGEIGTNCTAPAVANAIAKATGVRLYQLPMTPERVWWALQERHDP